MENNEKLRLLNNVIVGEREMGSLKMGTLLLEEWDILGDVNTHEGAVNPPSLHLMAASASYTMRPFPIFPRPEQSPRSLHDRRAFSYHSAIVLLPLPPSAEDSALL